MSNYKSLDQQREGKLRVMGFDYYVHLFNLRVYEEKVLPAYRVFLEKDDTQPLITLLSECSQILDADPQLSERLLWSKKSREEDIGILSGSVYYNSRGDYATSRGERKTTREDKRTFAQGLLSSKILQVLCVPRDKGVSPEQNMGRTPLIPYLYERSEWIKDLFTSVRQVRGGTLEFSIGECTEIFTKQDLQEFNMQLDNVQPPKDIVLRKEYDNLRALLKLTLKDEDLTLALSVM